MFFLQAPYYHRYLCYSSMFSMAVNDANNGPASLSHNGSYMDCYGSPSFKDLNISTLPCFHHVLLENALYKTLKHIDDSISLKPARATGPKTEKQHFSAWYYFLVYHNFSSHCINSYTTIFQANSCSCPDRVFLSSQTALSTLPIW